MWGARLCWGVIAFVALGACASESQPRATVRQGILGGELDTTHGAVVALREFTSNETLCSGTVFSVEPTTGRAAILTAAHCIAVRLPSVIVVGSDYRANDVLRFVPTDAVAHPMFSADDPQSPYDIAVVRISGDVAQLPRMVVAGAEEHRPAVGDHVMALGFGLDDLEGGTSTARRSVDLVVSAADANEIRVDQASGSGICMGDSGGPLLVASESGEERVVGVHSRLEPAGPDTPPCLGTSVSTRVTGMRDFLASALAAAEPPECTLCRARSQSEGGACLAARRNCEARDACARVADCFDHCNTVVCKNQCMQTAASAEVGTLEALDQCPCTTCAALCPPTDTCTKPSDRVPPVTTDAAPAPTSTDASPDPRSEGDRGCGCTTVGRSQRGAWPAGYFAMLGLGLGLLLARRSTRGVPRS